MTSEPHTLSPDEPRTTHDAPGSAPMGRVGLIALALVALVFVAVPVVRTFTRGPQEPLPVLFSIPAWSLTDQDGRAFGSEQLRGRVYVANFVFTSCTTSCPRLSRVMAILQGRLRSHGDRARLVSISVDPTTDTPERLRAYAARYHADHTRWSFVTGPEETVMRAVSDGFRVGVVQPPRGPNGEFDPIALAHSNRFAVIDARGRMRGSYEVDQDGIDRIVRDVGALLAERN